MHIIKLKKKCIKSILLKKTFPSCKGYTVLSYKVIAIYV